MAEIDTEKGLYLQLTPTPAEFDISVDHTMDDHDMLIEHVAQYDHEIYGLDCCLTEMFGT